MTVEIRILTRTDEAVLSNVASGVFDQDVNPALSHEFLEDARHHIAVAIDNGVVVGFASAVHYVHPDKAAQLFINEVGVAPSHQNRGIGKSLLHALFEVGRELDCTEAWVLTERSNAAAMALYHSAGGNPTPEDSVTFTFRFDG